METASNMAKLTKDWGDNFTLLTPEEGVCSVVATSQGAPGGGKSHFWMTAPGPIAWFLFDPGGLKGLRNNPLFAKKEIHVSDYCGDLNIGKLDKDERMVRSIAAMERFQSDWDIAVRNARTLVVDKESMLWEMVRYAHDEVASPQPKNFHELNLLYRGWIQDAEVNGRNLGLIRDVHDTWGKIGVSSTTGKPQMGFTGDMKPDGQKYATSLVQVNLSHRWNADEETFETEILEKCRLGSAKKLIGKVVADLDFPTLGMMLFPNSDVSDWE